MELLQFADDAKIAFPGVDCVQPIELEPWTILIVDDDPEVHAVTRLALKSFEYEGRALRMLEAVSGADAKATLASEPDIALILLDVVMDTDNAGLDLVVHIREELKNTDTRIVLRTGQPGMAPEESVIRIYDINDYKNKTELTRTKLHTLLSASLRAYRDICMLNRHRLGLERAIGALSHVAQSRSIPGFASAVLAQLANLIRLPQAALFWNVVSAFAERKNDPAYRLLAVSGMHLSPHSDGRAELPSAVDAKLQEAFRLKHSIWDDSDYIGFFRTQMGSENLLYLAGCGKLSPLDMKLLELYCANVAVAYENLLLHEDVEESQRELIFLLGEAVEMRSRETGGHVKRVAAMAATLASDYGLPEGEVELIRHAAPLHDVGKVGIPDVILNKPGRHTPDEWEVMQSHALLGFEMLNKSDKQILKRGAVIALQHHEKWDGSGYPCQLKGMEIDVFARITALSDVFDALGSARCYKEPWNWTKVVDHVRAESGKHFEPRLVDLLIARLPEYLSLREIYPD